MSKRSRDAVPAEADANERVGIAAAVAAVLGPEAKAQYDAELDPLLTAFASGDDPLAGERLQCFLREWAYSAMVVEDFGGPAALNAARQSARKASVPLSVLVSPPDA